MKKISLAVLSFLMISSLTACSEPDDKSAIKSYTLPEIKDQYYKPICVGEKRPECDITIESGTYTVTVKDAKVDDNHFPNAYNMWVSDKVEETNIDAFIEITPDVGFFDGQDPKSRELTVEKGQLIYIEDLEAEGTGLLHMEKK